MNQSNVVIAKAYYTAMAEKNVAAMEMYLYDEVRFISPFGEVLGKEKVLEAVRKFTQFFKALTIRATFGSEDQVVVIYDVDFNESIGTVRTASLLTFKDGLITGIELFFDARSF